MTDKKLAPDELPYWPRRLSRDLAAAYVGVSPGKFDAGVIDGTWPQAIEDGGRRLWDRLMLDAAVDRQSGRSPNTQAESGLGDVRWGRSA